MRAPSLERRKDSDSAADVYEDLWCVFWLEVGWQVGGWWLVAGGHWWLVAQGNIIGRLEYLAYTAYTENFSGLNLG